MIAEFIGALLNREKGLSFKQRFALQMWYSTDPYRYIAYSCLAYDLIDKTQLSDLEREAVAFTNVKKFSSMQCIEYVLDRNLTIEITEL